MSGKCLRPVAAAAATRNGIGTRNRSRRQQQQHTARVCGNRARQRLTVAGSSGRRQADINEKTSESSMRMSCVLSTVTVVVGMARVSCDCVHARSVPAQVSQHSRVGSEFEASGREGSACVRPLSRWIAGLAGVRQGKAKRTWMDDGRSRGACVLRGSVRF